MEVNYSAPSDQWPAPSLADNFELPLSTLQIATLVPSAACTALTCALFAAQTRAVCGGMRNARAKIRVVSLIGLLPFTAAVSFVAMCIPRAIPMCNLVIAVYYARCLFAFVEVISTDIHGDRRLLKMAVTGARAQLNVSIFRFMVCLPRPLANGRLLQRIEWLVWQNGLVRVFIMFVISAVSANRVGAPHDTPRPLVSVMAVLGVASTLTAVWALNVYERLVASNMTAYRALLYCKLMALMVAAVNFLPNLGILFGYSLGIVPPHQRLNGSIVAQVGAFVALIAAVTLVSLALTVLARPGRNKLLAARAPSEPSLAPNGSGGADSNGNGSGSASGSSAAGAAYDNAAPCVEGAAQQAGQQGRGANDSYGSAESGTSTAYDARTVRTTASTGAGAVVDIDTERY